MMNFTKKLFFLAIVALLPFAASAQLGYTFEVTSPAGVAGTYDVLPASFGPVCSIDTLVGPLMFIEDIADPTSDGCDSTSQDMTGAIAMVDRGGCNFTAKVINAQNAGAIGVIICNNKSDAIFGPGGSDPAVTIHSFMLSKSDCEKIRAEVPGAMASLTPITVREDDRAVFWSEDFNNGMEGWTVENRNDEGDDFIWSEDGVFVSAFGGRRGIALGGASCTGAVGFPSGWYQTGRTGDPDSIPSAYTKYDADLISPAIDLSAVTSGVAVEFDQGIQRLNGIGSGLDIFSRFYYSIDDGETWSSPIVVNPDLEVNSADITTPPLNTIERFALPGAQGHDKVKLKFNWTCDFYFWIIDNVKILERENDNMAVTSYFAIPPNAQTPENQVVPFNIVADVANLGGASQDNVKLDVVIEKDGAEVFSVSKEYGTIAADSTATDQVFDELYTPEGVGSYSGKYEVKFDNADFDSTNNVQEFVFQVTNDVFSKEMGDTDGGVAPNNSNWADGQPRSWAIGNVYKIVNNTDAEGHPIILDHIEVGVASPADLQGKSMFVILYKWDDANGNGNMDVDEYNSVASFSYEFTGNEVDGELIGIELEDEEEDGNDLVNLEANTTYVATVQYTAPFNTSEHEFYIDINYNFNYFAQMLTNSGSDVEVAASTFGYGIGEPYFNHVIGIQPDPDTPFNSIDYKVNDFGAETSALIRMYLGVATDNEDILSDENKITVYPNPTQDVLNIQIELKNETEQATMNVVDVTGKVVLTQQYNNVKEGNFKFNTSALANGVYNLNIITNNGFRSTKFVVQR